MSEYTAAIIGTGPDPENPTVEGFAMGYRHAEAYRNNDDCRLVACADIVRENADAFAREFDIEDIYEDYSTMLAEVEPDIVSVTVPPAIHETVVIDCARSGLVAAIHCEKPMANTLASAERMVLECWRRDVQLTFNRQRRFARPFTEANRLLEDGIIGPLRRVEISWGDFFDTGAHTVDLVGMFNDERSAEWIIAQLDYREGDIRFGTHQENQMWAQWRYKNGVYGVLSTGEGTSMTNAALVLRGTDGTIRIDVDGGPMLECEYDGGRQAIDVDDETMHGTDNDDGRFGSRFQDRSVSSVVTALHNSTEPPLSGRIGLNTAEILFGGYESVRQRGRVDLPHAVTDNPLKEMVESGAISPVLDPNSEE